MEKRYMISDASHLVQVESHVLRYWEEELDIAIPRNEMGHRYYTDYHINLFKNIKCLKERGFLLKAIKLALPEIMSGKDPMTIDVLKNDYIQVPTTSNSTTFNNNNGSIDNMPCNTSSCMSQSDKLAKFEEILGNIVSRALNENNNSLSETVSSSVSNTVLKEMDYLFRIREEKEEEHFKKLDETIRLTQNKAQKKKKLIVGKLLHKLS